MPSQPDVLIAGAGPAGSSMATWLARAGHRVLAVDRAAFPRDKPCSEYLSPAAVELLDRLGVVADLERSGAQPLTGTRVFGPRGAALAGSFARAPVPPPRAEGLAVARRVLDARLVQAAREAGAEVRERTTVEDLLYAEGGVAGAVLRDASGKRTAVHARIVVGADGLRSLVARRIGKRRRGFPARLAFVAHVGDVPGLDGYAEMHVGTEGYVGLNRIWAGSPPHDGTAPRFASVSNVALVVPTTRAAEARGRLEEFFFSRLERFPGVGTRVRRENLMDDVLVTGPFAAWSGRVTTGGALLVGDAADFFDPFTGEGIYSALRGAALASETVHAALAAGRGPVSAAQLAGYGRARRAAFLGKWAVERLVGYGMTVPALFDRAVRKLERRGLADTFIAVTADLVPARMVLHPWFLARMVL